MKNKKLLLSLGGIVLFSCLFLSFKSEIMLALKNYDLSTYNVVSGKTRTKFLTSGSLSDSTEVHHLSSGETRRIAPLSTILADYALLTTVNGKASNSNTITINGTSQTIGSNPSFNVKSVATYSGTTNASGNYTVTFVTAYPVAPNIQASISNQSNVNQFIRVTSVSTTGFTVNVSQRSPVTLLSIEVLLAATTNVTGANVDVLVTAK